MNDKINDPQEKIETAIDSEELRDEELQDVAGGPIYVKIKGIKGDVTRDEDQLIEPVITTDYKR